MKKYISMRINPETNFVNDIIRNENLTFKVSVWVNPNNGMENLSKDQINGTFCITGMSSSWKVIFFHFGKINPTKLSNNWIVMFGTKKSFNRLTEMPEHQRWFHTQALTFFSYNLLVRCVPTLSQWTQISYSRSFSGKSLQSQQDVGEVCLKTHAVSGMTIPKFTTKINCVLFISDY